MPNLQHIVCLFECKNVDENRVGTFEGYGSTFGNIDLGDDVIVSGAFKKTLAKWRKSKSLPAMPWYHDMRTLVGEYDTMEEDDKGLRVKGMLWVEGNEKGRTPIEAAKMAHNMVRASGPKGLSIGFFPIKYDFGEQEGRRVRFLREVDLVELSLVPFGMNPQALITSAKSIARDGEVADVRTIEAFLRDAGLSRTQAKAFIADGYKGIAPRDEAVALLDLAQSAREALAIIKG